MPPFERRPRTIPGLLVAVGRIYLRRTNGRRFAQVFVFLLLLLVAAVVWRAAWPTSCTASSGTHANDSPRLSVAVTPSIAGTASGYGLTWVDLRDRHTEVYFARLAPDGARIGEPRRLTNDDGVKLFPQLVWSGAQFGLSWTAVSGQDAAVWFVRLDPTGPPIGAAMRVSLGGARAFGARVAWNGRAFGVAWFEVRSAREFGVRVARIDAEGRRIGDAIDVRTGAIVTGMPDVVADRTGFAVSFNEVLPRAGQTATTVVRIPAEGAADEPVILSLRAGLALQSTLAVHRGGTLAAAWRDGVGVDGSTLAAATLRTDGTKTGRVEITDGRGHAGSPSIFAGRDAFGLAWTQSGTAGGVRFVRIGLDGQRVGEPLALTTHNRPAQTPSVAWGRTEYAVAWCDARAGGLAIYVARVSASGTRVGEDVRVSAD